MLCIKNGDFLAAGVMDAVMRPEEAGASVTE